MDVELLDDASNLLDFPIVPVDDILHRLISTNRIIQKGALRNILELPVDMEEIQLGETHYQEHYLSPRISDSEFFVDSHSTSTPVAPLFMLPIECASTATYNRTAKPDLMSTILPLTHEIKSSPSHSLQHDAAAVVLQGLERAYVMERIHGFLSQAFCICLTRNSAWFISLKRRESHHPVNGIYRCDAAIRIERIEPTQVQRLWKGLVVAASENPRFYLLPDAIRLIAAITANFPGQYNPFLCRIRLMACFIGEGVWPYLSGEPNQCHS